MATTLTRPLAPSAPEVSGFRLDPRGHRRRPALAVGSLALVVTCVAVFVSVYLKAGHEDSVLALARAVPEGVVLTPGDLMSVRISTTSGVVTVPTDDASAVVGRMAAERLEPDTLLSTNELVTRYAPPAGESVVGIAAKEGQIPASGVAPGETVDVVLTGLPGAQDSASPTSDTTGGDQSASGTPSSSGAVASTSAPGTVLVADATVIDVVPSPASSGSDDVDVSLLTSSALAPLVATASAAGQVALIVVAPAR